MTSSIVVGGLLRHPFPRPLARRRRIGGEVEVAGKVRARVRSNGRGCHIGGSPPTRSAFSFTRSPTISETFCARWRRRSR